MNVADVAKASCDSSVDALCFYPIVRESQLSDDSWLRDFASDAFLRKCANTTLADWNELEGRLQGDDADSKYLLALARLGRLFISSSNPNRDEERCRLILWLIQTAPASYCLGQAYCFDLGGDWYELLKSQWLKAVDENPNELRVVSNAARFFFDKDEEIAAQMLQECNRLAPDDSSWIERLEKLRDFHSPKSN